MANPLRFHPHVVHEQHAILVQHGDKPMPVVDPVDQKVYFLVAGDLFERFRALFNDDDFDIRKACAAQSDVARKAGWDLGTLWPDKPAELIDSMSIIATAAAVTTFSQPDDDHLLAFSDSATTETFLTLLQSAAAADLNSRLQTAHPAHHHQQRSP